MTSLNKCCKCGKIAPIRWQGTGWVGSLLSDELMCPDCQHSSGQKTRIKIARPFVIFSLAETLRQSPVEPMYWSNDQGWVDLSGATVFGPAESECNMPLPDGVMIELPACSAFPVAQPPRDVSERYHELLYAVASKFPGESRHETALRYIRDTEERVCEVGSCKQNTTDQARGSRAGSNA